MHGSVVVGTIGCNIHGNGKGTAGTASQQHHHTLAGETMLASLVPVPYSVYALTGQHTEIDLLTVYMALGILVLYNNVLSIK